MHKSLDGVQKVHFVKGEMFLHPIYLVPTYQTFVEEKMMGGGGDCLTSMGNI